MSLLEGTEHIWTHEVNKSLFKFQKHEIFAFSPSVPLQLILKYAYTLNVLIHHIVHMDYIDYTLPILQI